MVGDHAKGYVCIIIFTVRHTCKFAYLIAKCLQCINIEHGIYILYDTCKSLKSHTGINVLLFQFCIIVMSVIVKLGKYVVPDLHVSVTFTSYGTSRFAAAVFLTAVIIDLRTWTARA